MNAINKVVIDRLQKDDYAHSYFDIHIRSDKKTEGK